MSLHFRRRWAWTIVLLVRLLNAFSVRTYFQPDEFYQALEPAHKLVYGYGYTTWEWTAGLRSLLHPLLYAAAYHVASTVFPQSDSAAINSPRIIGALISTCTDYYMYRVALRFTGSKAIAQISVILLLLSPFTWYFSTRSFSSTFETALMVAGLSYWPLDGKFGGPNTKLARAIVLGLLSCIVRPTNAIVWLYMGLEMMVTCPSNWQRLLLLLKCAGIVLLVILGSFLADYGFYGTPTFSLYNFIQFNVVNKLLVFYGENPWHFYLLQAVPAMTGMYLPVLIYAMFSGNFVHPLGAICITFAFAMLLIAHKEIRFIYPLQPLLMIICASTIQKARFTSGSGCKKIVARAYIVSTILVHLALAFYMSRVNERGVIDIAARIRHDPSTFGLLMPCHSTPWQSHFHRRGANVWFLTCEPPIHLAGQLLETIRGYQDESDLFYADPVKFISANFPPFNSDTTVPNANVYLWPDKLIVFEQLRGTMDSILGGTYDQCDKIFNSRFHWDPRRRGDLIVYCKRGKDQSEGTTSRQERGTTLETEQ